MSVRDLLTFNLFLQFTDGLVSYQAFALGAIEANPVVAAAIGNWGMGWGLIYNKALACLLLLLIFALRRNRRLLAIPGTNHYGLGVRVRHYCVSLGTPPIESPLFRLRHLGWTKYKLGSIPEAYKALPQLPKWASAALTIAGTSRRDLA